MREMVAKLGVTERPDNTAPRLLDTEPLRAFDRAFRNEVTELVHEILRRNYVTQRESAETEAHRWGLTLEQLVAASVAHQVMSKVDAEYV